MRMVDSKQKKVAGGGGKSTHTYAYLSFGLSPFLKCKLQNTSDRDCCVYQFISLSAERSA